MKKATVEDAQAFLAANPEAFPRIRRYILENVTRDLKYRPKGKLALTRRAPREVYNFLYPS